MSLPNLSALVLTLQLAFVVTVILLIIGTPLAWWLARTRMRAKPVVEALVALPLVLPPTVIGFYLLIALNPHSPIGSFWISITGETLTFSFAGLVIGSLIYLCPLWCSPCKARSKQAPKRRWSLQPALVRLHWMPFLPLLSRRPRVASSQRLSLALRIRLANLASC